jgi:hypothetical protein
MANELSLNVTVHDIVNEYHKKLDTIDTNIENYQNAYAELKMNTCVFGTWGDYSDHNSNIYKNDIVKSLKTSAWRTVYQRWNLVNIMPLNDIQRFENAMQNPPEFNYDSVVATFGDYLLKSRYYILKNLADAFCALEPFYKSHDKVKIGVKGLPKRVVLEGYRDTYNLHIKHDGTIDVSCNMKERIKRFLNPLAVYQGKKIWDYQEINLLCETGDRLKNVFKDGEFDRSKNVFIEGGLQYPERGISIKKFKNGNVHIIFDDISLNDINKALNEFYGDVLPDCEEEKPTKKAESREVSKDLQYYPTPKHIVEKVLDNIWLKDQLILEPQAGCGRFMDAIREKGGIVEGVEYDLSRVLECRKKGHIVTHANFLEVEPVEKFDAIVMNPPFFGKHYFKHITHALKFLKKGGKLISILPSTARYDHGLIDSLPNRIEWYDLPVASFSESGTNISTSVVTIYKK